MGMRSSVRGGRYDDFDTGGDGKVFVPHASSTFPVTLLAVVGGLLLLWSSLQPGILSSKYSLNSAEHVTRLWPLRALFQVLRLTASLYSCWRDGSLSLCKNVTKRWELEFQGFKYWNSKNYEKLDFNLPSWTNETALSVALDDVPGFAHLSCGRATLVTIHTITPSGHILI